MTTPEEVVYDLAEFQGETPELIRERLVRCLFGDPDDPETGWVWPEEVSS